MEYEIVTWPISNLLEIYSKDKLILNPPYQRNPIWSLKAQKMLIKTIKSLQPMPNFFIHKKSVGNYEIVDGQQRTRTIIGYWKGDFADNEGVIFNDDFHSNSINDNEKEQYLNYLLSITIISDVQEDESIEAFYALVNSSGLRLNRPELKKAEYYSTNFLHLITNLSEYPDFNDLKLFTSSSVNRMNNVDFVSELIALIKYGISEKKEKVDELFEKDVSEREYQSLKDKFIIAVSNFGSSEEFMGNFRYRKSAKCMI